ncbi:MAG: transcriptional regulator, partial [Chloroflexaceae bacterium]|nr:transcriptional regulator [Chloroflexaceae bacterium]
MAGRFFQKLTVPSAEHIIVERLELTNQLEAAISTRRVVTVLAPAGWGKTTALLQWARTTPLPVCWYTLDPTDRDPLQFLDYLLQTLKPVVPEATHLAEQLAVAGPSALAELYRETGQAMAAAPAPFALLLDDFHTLEDNSSDLLPGTTRIFEFLANICAYAPNCKLVLASRTLPSLRGLARLSAQRQAQALDYGTLQFSTADVQRLAGLTRGLMLSQAEAARLIERFNGWAIGIALFLEQAPQGDDDTLLTDDANLEQIYRYFAEQTTANLSPQLQQFLEETSVLDDLSPQRCDDLLERDDSVQLLDELARHGLFTSQRAGVRAYHALFRDFLRTRLARRPARQRALLLRAGTLYRNEDDLERAIGCYLAADATTEAVEAMREAGPRYRQRSRHTTLLACYDHVQAALHSARPPQPLPADLSLAQAHIYADLAVWERAHAALQQAEWHGNQEMIWEAKLTAVEFYCIQGEKQRAQMLIEQLEPEKLPPQLRLIYHHANGRVQVLNGNIDRAIVELEQALALSPANVKTGVASSKLAAIHDLLGWAYLNSDSVDLTLYHLRQADTFWQSSGNVGRRAVTLSNLGVLAAREGRYEEAREALVTGLSVAKTTGRRRDEAEITNSLAELDMFEGQFESAQERLEQVRGLAKRLNLAHLQVTIAINHAWIWALQQHPARSWASLDLTAPLPEIQPELVGRVALTKALLLCQNTTCNLSQLEHLIEQVAPLAGLLNTVERSYLLLLRTHVAYMVAGWQQARQLWLAFETQAAAISSALLLAFSQTHQQLFALAATESALARRFTTSAEAAPTCCWQIKVLGPFACTVGEQLCELSPLYRAVLVRLLDAGSGGLAVERLWEAIWGEAELSMAALHQALRRLRMYTRLEISIREGICSIRTPWQQI